MNTHNNCFVFLFSEILGQNVMATLGIKPRKPRGRGRGSKVNMGDRIPPVVQTPLEPGVEETVSDTPKKVSLFNYLYVGRFEFY